MNKKLRLNLLLVSAIILILAFLIMTSEEESVAQIFTLSSLQYGEMTRILIKRTGKEDILFNKIGNIWQITSPFTVRAHENRIVSMLALLQSRSFSQLSVEEINLNKLGLDNPSIVLRLNDEEFFFGDTNPLEDHRYILYKDTVHLISDNLFPQLQQRPSFFISPRLLPKDSVLTKMRFPEHSLNLNNQHWSVTPDMKVNQKKLNELAKLWQSAMAVSVTRYAPKQTMETIMLTTNGEKTIRFDILEKEPNLLLARRDLGIQYLITGTLAGQLLLQNL